jgi:hypothetical protein
VSSPSTPQNTIIRHKPKEINLRAKWHSSYASPDKIEDVEIKKERSPATAPGFFSFGQSYSRFERAGLYSRCQCHKINGALQAAEKLAFLLLGGSRGLQPPE